MEPELVAYKIIREALDISIGSIRGAIRSNMDENAMVNGFALMVTLKDIEKQLDLLVRNVDYHGKDGA